MNGSTTTKIIIFLVVVGLAIGGYKLMQASEGGRKMLGTVLPAAKVKEAVVPAKADLPALNTDSGGDLSVTPVVDNNVGGGGGGASSACVNGKEVRMLVWAWNAQMGIMYSNSAPQSTQTSLMCKQGVNLQLSRQDDVSKMQEALVTFADSLSRGEENPSSGAHFVAIMGDGGAAFLSSLNKSLSKYGPEYKAKVIATCGYSRGEDKFMGPASWKVTPRAARGGVVAGYLRDGDWNIAQKWLADNEIKNNPDEKTYDPDALNWVAANDYIDAAEKYVTGYTEKRPVVKNGKPTGETKTIKVDASVTWTPGDVTIAKKKGGLVSIVSTKEYNSQMPCIVIGIDKWMKNNREDVKGMLTAFYQGADQVKKNPAALNKAAAVSAAVYKEQDAAYWAKYYKGVTEDDAQNIPVPLGGSSVNNLRDALLTFGMVPGSSDLFAATYTVFGNIVKQQYPELMPSFPSAEEITDKSYLREMATKTKGTTTKVAKADLPKFVAPSESNRQEISRRAWKIRFKTGQASFTPDAVSQLTQLQRDLLIAGNTVVEVHGHTDNVGDPAKNMTLSEARAFAVEQWLQKKSPVNFPQGRVRVFSHGSENPVVPNSTEAGKAQNRRVEIVLLGNTGG
ncbi:MAG: OmpA family protein [Akkermansiaceae bacterium]|nr:OmpA family protein [Armatimonadota bacterium]